MLSELYDRGQSIQVESEEEFDNTSRDEKKAKLEQEKDLDFTIEKARKRIEVEYKINQDKLKILMYRKQKMQTNSKNLGMFDKDGKPLVHEMLYIDNNAKLHKQQANLYPEVLKSNLSNTCIVTNPLKEKKSKSNLMQNSYGMMDTSNMQRPGSGRSAITANTLPTQTQTVFTGN